MKQHFVVPPTEDSVQSFGIGSIIGGKYRLEEKIGQGSFGMIYKCLNMETQEIFAVKLEKRNQRHSSMLVREIKVMMEMKNDKGFAKIQTYGKDDEYNYVVMSYLGRNLDSLLKKCKGIFTTQTVVNVAEQMISLLEALHNKNLIHRDIKPENYVIGYGSNFTVVYLIDFGLAKYYKDSEGNHIPFIEKKGMIGTARYASINAHLGHEQSRRDDLEALGYVLLYFAKGKLPWQNIYADTKEEKYQKIQAMKQSNTIEQLCENLPSEYMQYFKHIKSLGFEDTPNYTMLKKLFSKIAVDKKIESQVNTLDWESLPDYRQRKKYQTVAAYSSHSQQNAILPLNLISKSHLENDKDPKKQDSQHADKQLNNKDKLNENNIHNSKNSLEKDEKGSSQKVIAAGNGNNNKTTQNQKEEAEKQLHNGNNYEQHKRISENNFMKAEEPEGAKNQQHAGKQDKIASHSAFNAIQNDKLITSSKNINQNTHTFLNNNNNLDSQELNEPSITNLNNPNNKHENLSNLNTIAAQYLNVPNNEKVTNNHSVTSANSGGTSKLNNYMWSESQDVTNEESIKVVEQIQKQNQVSNPHTMVQDIRVKSQLRSFGSSSHGELPQINEESKTSVSLSPDKFSHNHGQQKIPVNNKTSESSKLRAEEKRNSIYLGENISDQAISSDHFHDVRVMEVKSAFKLGPGSH